MVLQTQPKRLTPPGAPRTGVRIAAWLICIAGLLVLAELASYAIGKLVLVPSAVLYTPPEIAEAEFDRFLEQRDPILGWTAKFRKTDIDARGSRRNSFFDESTPACVSAYGDSFTYSEEVAAPHAWPNVLSGLIGCRVENFGVGGYGTDQAFLRFQTNSGDRASRVLLVHQVENILRNVNQYRQLLYAGSGLGFKPVFHESAEGLKVEPPLAPNSFAELKAIIQDPGAHLEHEYFLPGGLSGKRSFAFPYVTGALLSMREFHMWASLMSRPWYADFYSPDHPSHALPRTVEIMRLFRQTSRSRGQAGIVVLLPSPKEVAHRNRTGAWSYEPLARELSRLDIPHIDIGAALLTALGGKDPCSLAQVCSGHFNRAGYELLARILKESLASLTAQSADDNRT